MEPCFVSTEDDDAAANRDPPLHLQWSRASSARKTSSTVNLRRLAGGLQWSRASSARKTRHIRCRRNSPRPSFNGAVLRQHGRRNYRSTRQSRHKPSMEPCFVSTEDIGTTKAGYPGRLPSMEPCFVSTEDLELLAENERLAPFNGAVLRQHGRQPDGLGAGGTAGLQWSRASSARKTGIDIPAHAWG